MAGIMARSKTSISFTSFNDYFWFLKGNCHCLCFVKATAHLQSNNYAGFSLVSVVQMLSLLHFSKFYMEEAGDGMP